MSGFRPRFQHLYFYVFDPVMGPMSLRVSTYLSFSIQVWLNGHSFVAEQLTRQGVGFEKYDNAILAVDDVEALKATAAALTPELIRERCDHWAHQLAPRFTETERDGAGLDGYHSAWPRWNTPTTPSSATRCRSRPCSAGWGNWAPCSAVPTVP